MKIYVEEGNLKATKSCEICAHKSSCKFYAKTKELFKSNEFYEMTEYLEWNNNLEAWSENKSCQYYYPFLFDKKLFELEIKKNNSFVHGYGGWYNLVLDYFNLVHRDKHQEYFEAEIVKQRLKSWATNKTDEELYKHCFQQSSSKKIYSITANDGSWQYEITLTEVLEFFNAFKELE